MTKKGPASDEQEFFNGNPEQTLNEEDEDKFQSSIGRR